LDWRRARVEATLWRVGLSSQRQALRLKIFLSAGERSDASDANARLWPCRGQEDFQRRHMATAFLEGLPRSGRANSSATAAIAFMGARPESRRRPSKAISPTEGLAVANGASAAAAARPLESGYPRGAGGPHTGASRGWGPGAFSFSGRTPFRGRRRGERGKARWGSAKSPRGRRDPELGDLGFSPREEDGIV
jgi:hypothetical protein